MKPAVILLLLVAAIGGGWWYVRQQPVDPPVDPPDNPGNGSSHEDGNGGADLAAGIEGNGSSTDAGTGAPPAAGAAQLEEGLAALVAGDRDAARAALLSAWAEGDRSVKRDAASALARWCEGAAEPERPREGLTWRLRAAADDAARDRIWEEIESLNAKLFDRAPTPEDTFFHRVESGELLTTIARTHGVRMEGIKLVNGMGIDDDMIRVGQRLKVPHPDARPHVEVDMSAFRLTLFLDTHRAFRRYRIGIGREGDDTPAGEYVTGYPQHHPAWTPVGREMIPYGHPDNPLGDYWVALLTPDENPEDREKTGYGIHGTNEPETVGTRASAGCVRMINEQAWEVYALAGLGASAVIRE